MKVTIEAIYISSGHDFKGRHGKGRKNHVVESVNEVECVEGRGLVGDRFFDYKENFKGQITFFDTQVIEDIKVALNPEPFEDTAFRRNVYIKGVDLNTLIGKQFSIKGVLFEGTEEAYPCYWMDEAIGEGAEEFLKGRAGLRARILSSGMIGTGSVELSLI